MALQTKILTADGSKGHHRFTLTINENSINPSTNKSPIDFTFQLSPIRTSWNWYGWGNQISYSINIAGNIFSGSIPDYDGYSTVTLNSGNLEIEHNEDGTKSIHVAFSVNDSAGQTFTPGNASASDIMILTEIPRGSILNEIKNFNVDSGARVKFTKNLPECYDVLKIKYGNTILKTINDFKTTTTNEKMYGKVVVFDENELNTIYSLISNSNGVFVFELETYSDETMTSKIGVTSTMNAIGSLTYIKPTFTNFEYIDSNLKTNELTGDNSIIVKGYSTLKIIIAQLNKAIANTRGTTISHYLVDGQTLKNDVSEPSLEILNYLKDNVTVYAIDSRGTSSDAINISFIALNKFIDYSKIIKNSDYSATREENGTSEKVVVSFSGSFWNDNFGVSNNQLTATYKYKKSTDDDYIIGTTNIVLNIEENNFSFSGLLKGDTDLGFDLGEVYEIIVIVKDELSDISIKISLQAGSPAMAVYKNKVALGGKYDEDLGGTQIFGDLYHNGQPLNSYKIGDLFLTMNEENPADRFGGIWEKIKEAFLFGASDNYPVGTTGGEKEHELTTDEIPEHNHQEKLPNVWNFKFSQGSTNGYVSDSTNGPYPGDVYNSTHNTGEVGGNKPHNNMPPFIAIYIWKKIG